MKHKVVQYIFIILILTAIAGGYFYFSSKAAQKINASKANNLTSGLVGYWTFDGQDTNWGTNTTNDRSGNGYNGAMTNMSTSTSPAPGVAGQALNFDGSTSYVNTNQSDAFNITGSVTVSAWIYPTGTATIQRVFSKMGDDAWGAASPFDFMINGTTKVVSYQSARIDEAQILSSISTINLNQWNHVVMIRDLSQTKVTFYINGTQDSGGWQLYDTYYIGTNTDKNAVIGYNPRNNNQFFRGSIDEVRIYNRALSASEITELYNMGR